MIDEQRRLVIDAKTSADGGDTIYVAEQALWPIARIFGLNPLNFVDRGLGDHVGLDDIIRIEAKAAGRAHGQEIEVEEIERKGFGLAHESSWRGLIMRHEELSPGEIA